MNEQLQAKLVEILASIQATTKAGGDFVLDQLPDVVQSYILYGRIASLGSILLALVLIACGLYLIYMGRKENAKDILSQSFPILFIVQPLGWIGLPFGLISLFFYGNQALLVWFAPKVWLLKEIAGLLK